MSKSKSPTAQGISRLLATAGFERSERRQTGADLARTEGFAVASGVRTGVVTVEHCAMLGTPVEQYEQWHERYAETIGAAGYATEIDDLGVIVTAKED